MCSRAAASTRRSARAGAALPRATFRDLSDAEEAAYRAAAVRELQEEANVASPSTTCMPFAHWVTPEIEIRRYDTRFFLARMPDRQIAKHDESETTALEWLSPSEAIARFNRRELLLPPPTYTSIRQLAPRTSIDDVFAWARSRPIARVMPGFFKNGDEVTLTLPGDPTVPDDSRLGSAGGDAVRAAGWSPMAAIEGLTGAIDQVITYFNARRLDLPDGFFDRRTQFVINGAPFETLLGQSPNDPLILMLARGPAGFRFTAKALQHAIPDAKSNAVTSMTDGDPFKVDDKLGCREASRHR